MPRAIAIGIGLPFGGAVAFSPLALFAASEPGVWYDPSDLSTMFQNSAGTTPVTGLEQPVGLVLDKSKGLVIGSELVTNGDFSNGTTGWSNTGTGAGSFTVSGGKATCTTVDGSNFVKAQTTVTTIAGRTYRATYSLTRVSGATFYHITGPGVALTSGGDVTFYFTASGTSSAVTFQTSGNAAGVFELDNISVKEIAGNHASQSTSASRPVLSARYNLLTYTEQFDNAAWGKTGLLAFGSGSVANAIAAPDGATTADKIVEDTSTGDHRVFQAYASIVSGVEYTFTVFAKAAGRTLVTITSATGVVLGATFDIQSGAVTNTTNGTAAVSSVGDGWFRISVRNTANSTTSTNLQVRLVSTGTTTTYTGDGTSGIYIWGADLRPANDGVGLPSYQRVGAATAGSSTASGTADYDSTGFPYYLRADGVDDRLATSAIDFSGTDAVTVFAGLRKLSDAARGTVVELTASAASNNGAFQLTAPNAASATYAFESKGTALTDAVASSSVAAPITSVLTGQSDISADSNVLRVNGAQADSDTGDQGTGNFSNAILYVGARGAASQHFNGRIYGLAVLGRLATANEIASMEAWLNARTRAF